jgi:DMSO/TMAO reductase YedYZ molybdopterin-dependent catalytic subunit
LKISSVAKTAGKVRGTLLLLIVGVLLLGGALFVLLQQLAVFDQAEQVEWDLLLVGRDGQEKVLSFNDVRALPSLETSGGFFSTVGVVYGPYTVKGVPIEALCDLVGGMTANDVLFVSAVDGYSSVYDYDQLTGEIDTFEPDTLRLVPGSAIQFVLIYQQDGELLSDEDGKPLRLAITNPDGLITEGHWWVKWVNRIEIRSLTPNPQGER